MKNTLKDELYPIISDCLIEKLRRDFPNILPEKEISQFELGRLIGRQDVIGKLVTEKEYQEKAPLDIEEEE